MADPGLIELRRATTDDAAALVALGEVVVPATYGSISPAYAEWCAEQFWSLAAVEDQLERLPHWVAEVDGEIVGVANLGQRADADGQPEPVLWKLYVRPDHHRSGLGRSLLDAVLAHVREVRQAPLVLQYVAGNERAAAFYAASGFEEASRDSSATIPGLEFVWMRREPSGDPVGGARHG
ncbi:GNAT family N-acetyltransferase [Nocardioides acrostichi]|uniref:GNAT family N-acetyltransferase n=1 Tax=Nocardioides acrostichi TaxID=2784339 RepID=A0A930V358_9ACTN|nr:GNAT family N-acetyltransferase [Nocardioides acrostichi]MBF4162885.1 GNAT family N-acetyltransferase [Nocardioides acrostichi]